jgi:hypothetical protein
MTLHDASKEFRWDTTHDCHHHDTAGGQIVAMFGLGLYSDDLERLKQLVPGLKVRELRRFEHDHDTWSRVDVAEASHVLP